MMSKVVYSTVCALAVFVLVGCVTPCTVYTDSKTPPVFGNIKLYGTDNVPFEYQEIGAHTLVVDTSNQQEALRIYSEQVRGLGAEAVLGFRMRPLLGTPVVFGFTVCFDTTQYELSGVAVKIKRP